MLSKDNIYIYKLGGGGVGVIGGVSGCWWCCLVLDVRVRDVKHL